jgi:hypothetical protein
MSLERTRCSREPGTEPARRPPQLARRGPGRPRLAALPGPVASSATVAAVVVSHRPLLAGGGTLTTSTCTGLGAALCRTLGASSRSALSASSRLGRSARPALAAAQRGRRLPLLVLLQADVAVAVLSGVVELATNRDRLASCQRLLIIDGPEPPCHLLDRQGRDVKHRLDRDLELQVLRRRAPEELDDSSLLSDVVVAIQLNLLP